MTKPTRDELVRARLEQELAAQGGELAPPWAHLPWIHRYSIGWRMGTGESYVMMWREYSKRLLGVPEALEYLRRHPPAPRTWTDWVATFLADRAGEGDEDDEDGALAARWLELAEAEKLVGDDVAYPAYVKGQLARGGVEAPWCRGDGPDGVLRYLSRELGFWARYLAEARVAWPAYVASQPPPPPQWHEAVAAIASGEDRCYRELAGGAVSLLGAWVRLGELPPPWRDGHDAIVSVEFDELADDRHRWAWWVLDVFEDRASWQAYLARWPAAPAGWREFFDEWVPELR